MTKTEFVAYVAEAKGMTKVGAKEAVDNVLECILTAMQEAGEVSIPGFGKFFVQDVEARERRNPSTGATFMSEAHKVPKFKFASNVKAEIR